MRTIKSSLDPSGSGSFTLFPEEPEDMWHAYNLISPSDRLRASAIRKITTESSTGTTKSTRIHTNLTISVEKIDFDPQAGQLRVNGRVAEENSWVALGMYHTLDLELKRNFEIWKLEWDSVALQTVKEACDPSERSEIGAVVLHEGLANICLVTDFMTILRQRIEVPIPRKRKGSTTNHEKGLEKFYCTVYDGIKRHFDFNNLKVILLASPGFVAEGLYNYIFSEALKTDYKPILHSKPKFLIVQCSTGHIHALNEVLKSPAIQSKLSNTRFAKESKSIEEFFTMLNQDENRAWYGPKEVKKAVDMGAVGTLLISNTLFRSNKISERKKYVKMTEDVKKVGGEVMILSSIHESGVRLDGLGGIAAILIYPVEDLDEVEDEEEEEEEDEKEQQEVVQTTEGDDKKGSNGNSNGEEKGNASENPSG